MQIDILDHVDNMAGNLDRTRAIAGVVSTDMARSVSGEGTRPKDLTPNTYCPCIPSLPDKYETLGRDIAEWARIKSEKSGVIDYCEVVKGLIIKDCPEFEEWLKKRNKKGTLAEILRLFPKEKSLIRIE